MQLDVKSFLELVFIVTDDKLPVHFNDRDTCITGLLNELFCCFPVLGYINVLKLNIVFLKEFFELHAHVASRGCIDSYVQIKHLLGAFILNFHVLNSVGVIYA